MHYPVDFAVDDTVSLGVEGLAMTVTAATNVDVVSENVQEANTSPRAQFDCGALEGIQVGNSMPNQISSFFSVPASDIRVRRLLCTSEAFSLLRNKQFLQARVGVTVSAPTMQKSVAGSKEFGFPKLLRTSPRKAT